MSAGTYDKGERKKGFTWMLSRTEVTWRTSDIRMARSRKSEQGMV